MNINGAKLYYEATGSGPATIVFAHGLIWSGRMFDNQVNALQDRYRCVTFDFRGQGQSEVTQAGYDMDTLTADAAALIQALACAPCHFLGLSMGGFVGMRLAIRQPELLRSLLLFETTADPEPFAAKYRRLNFVARWFGLRPVATPVMNILFGQKFMQDPARAALRAQWRQHLVRNDRIGITRAVTGVIERQGVYDQLDQIQTPTLIAVGDQDVATVPAKAERIHARIPGSTLHIIPGAGHTSTVEEPALVNRLIENFLSTVVI
ncbi:MAG: alpha/beta fold hydrolase [Caldilineaceae bacterium]